MAKCLLKDMLNDSRGKSGFLSNFPAHMFQSLLDCTGQLPDVQRVCATAVRQDTSGKEHACYVNFPWITKGNE